MPPEIAESLAIMTTLLGTGVFVLIGIRMRIGAKERMARIKAESGEGVATHRETIEALQSQVDVLSEEVADLNERVDFAERLLTQGRQQAVDRDGVTTPV